MRLWARRRLGTRIQSLWVSSPGLAPILAVLFVLPLSMHAIAHAHATLVSSEPAAGRRLLESPPRVRLVFSEPIEAVLGQILLTGGDGKSIELPARGDPRNVRALVAPLDVLAPGAYRVTWRIVSADGHPVHGSFVFYVGPAQGVAEAPPPLPGPLAEGPAPWKPAVAEAPLIPAALRGLALVCLMALCGLLFFLGSWRRGPAPKPMRIALWLAGGASLLLGAHLVAWLVNVAPGHRLGTGNVWAALGTIIGRVELARTALALLALWALALARRPRLALLFALGALLLSGASGHSAAIDPSWAVPSKALHLLAASAWLGGLLWLVLRERDDAPRFAREAGRVSSVALVALIVVALSGVAQALLFLPSPADLLRSAYGALVLAKVFGLVTLLAFGAYHRFRVLRRLGRMGMPATLRRSVLREVAVMGVVILLGGFLAYVPPPTAVEHSPANHSSPPSNHSFPP